MEARASLKHVQLQQRYHLWNWVMRKETERTNRESRAVCGAHVSITWALPDEERQRLPVTEGR